MRFEGDPFVSEVASKWQTKISHSWGYRHKQLIVNWLPRMDSNHDKVIQSHLCYRYTTRQYKSLSTSNLHECPTFVPETLGELDGLFQSPNLQEIFPSASADAASRGGRAE